MKRFVGLIMLTLATPLCAADTIYLKDEATGELLGPIPVVNGQRIRIGQRIFSIVTAPPRTAMPLQERMRRTVIPELIFQDVALSAVLDFLREASETYAPPDGDGRQRGINLIVQVGDRQAILERPINMQARGLTFYEALNAIASVARLTVTIDRNVVWLTPKP